MLRGIKTAVKKQKKILLIFLITIFLPSTFLGIFGVLALRNEKYRVIKQIENQQLQTANSIKSEIELRISEIESKLENLAGYLFLRQQDINNNKEILINFLEKDSLIEHVFLCPENNKTLFPLFGAEFKKNIQIPPLRFDSYLQEQIKIAENLEYIENDCFKAASVYKNAFEYSKDQHIKAWLLNLYARNLMKAGKYTGASVEYARITKDYTEELTESGLPLELHAKMQMVDCFKRQGNWETATDSAVAVFKNIVENKWNLTESQFNTYASIISGKLAEMVSDSLNINKETFRSKFQSLQQHYQKKSEQWRTINNLKSYIVPELTSLLKAEPNRKFPLKFSKRVGTEDYLVEAIVIRQTNQPEDLIFLGVKLDESFLKENILDKILKDVPLSPTTEISVTTLSGDTIRGNKNIAPDAVSTSVFLENSFPPWRLDVTYRSPKNQGEINILTSFYFWTIITLIVILVFGSGLIMRIVAREMEILKMKSDFVSSVSHEFKTPLTSIKALTERLETGKVTGQVKVKQYLTLISSDIERLIRLVSNILNFSAIEEGKKVYKFENTAVKTWLEQVVNNFRKENFESNLDIHIEIEEDIPVISIDRDALAQVIFNLLDNAAKFSPGSKKVASVTAGNWEDTIIICVKDKGIGIEKDDAEKIFEKFYRGKNAVDYSIRGTGLGLAFVKYTIEAHNGKIQLESEPGWSTKFSISLPAC